MNAELALYIGRRALEVAMIVSAPVLIVALVVGFGTALLQAVSSIRDMTLGMVLKIVAVAVTCLLAGGWMMEVSAGFTVEIFNHIRALGH